MPILGRLTVKDKVMASPTGIEGVRIVGGIKPEKKLENKVVRNDVVGSTYHLKTYHLMNSIRGQHLNTTPTRPEYLLLIVIRLKAKADVKGFQINAHFPKRWPRNQKTGGQKLHSINWSEDLSLLKSDKLNGGGD